MVDAVKIINYIQLALLVLLFALAFLYTSTVLLIPRFHHANNLLTINFCIALMCSSAYWTYFYVTLLFYPLDFVRELSCGFLTYFEMMSTIEIPLATVVVSVYRLCLIVYHRKRFFRNRRFVMIVIGCQWLVGILVSIPRYWLLGPVRIDRETPSPSTSTLIVILF